MYEKNDFYFNESSNNGWRVFYFIRFFVDLIISIYIGASLFFFDFVVSKISNSLWVFI